MAYSKLVLEHFNKPRNVGVMENTLETGVSMVGAPSCGDVLQFSVKIVDGVIVDAKFKAFGCGSAIASSSFLTEMIIGKTVEEALQLRNTDIANGLELPAIKNHCSVLAEEAVKKAIADYRIKQKTGSPQLMELNKLSNKMITISAEAMAHFHAIIQKKNAIGIYLTIEHGGCAGKKYKFEIVTNKTELDKFNNAYEEMQLDGFDLYIDNAAMLFVIGAKIDCQKYNAGMKIVVLNADGSRCCSCKKSFC